MTDASDTPITRVREARMTYGPRVRPHPAPIPHSGALVPFLRAEIGDSMTERFTVVALDSRNRPVAWGVVSIGTITYCPVSVADVLRFVLLAGAPTFVISHNHPSGDPTPSADDLDLTRRIAEAARLIGLRLLDHVIIGEGSGAYVSLVDSGLLAPGGAL